MSEHQCGAGGGCSGGSCDCSGHEAPTPEEIKLQENLKKIKNKIVVLSGKGGVGKSSVAVNIAVALSLAGKKTGLLDVDVHGPSVPRMLSLSGIKPFASNEKIEPVHWSENLSVMSLGFFLPDDDSSVIWRGPVKMGMITQFVRDVDWGELDFLVVDCPPGTGDEPLSALQTLGTDAVAVIVTTPQGVAVDDVRRSVDFCRQVGNPILGIVENMSGFICPDCGKRHDILGSGGGEALATQTGVPFLGSIPIDPEMVNAADGGYAYLKKYHDGETAHSLNAVVKPLLELSGSLQEKKEAGVAGVEELSAKERGNGNLTIAVPTVNGLLCQHFGHCEVFTLVEVSAEDKKVVKSEAVVPPPHEPGVLPKWLAEKGANVIIAGGMGSRAQSLFTENGIRVVTGAEPGAPEDLVAKYLEGGLQTGANTCDH